MLDILIKIKKAHLKFLSKKKPKYAECVYQIQDHCRSANYIKI